MPFWMTAALCLLGFLAVLFVVGLLSGNVRLAAGVVKFAVCLFMLALISVVLACLG